MYAQMHEYADFSNSRYFTHFKGIDVVGKIERKKQI